jgi:hypothetical protein
LDQAGRLLISAIFSQRYQVNCNTFSVNEIDRENFLLDVLPIGQSSSEYMIWDPINPHV